MAQPPFQELHLLTEPPAGGTESEFLQAAATVLHGPVDRRLHWSPHNLEHWSRNSTSSYSVKVPGFDVNSELGAISERGQNWGGARRRLEQGLKGSRAPAWPD
jgi:hypothetical protein